MVAESDREVGLVDRQHRSAGDALRDRAARGDELCGGCGLQLAGLWASGEDRTARPRAERSDVRVPSAAHERFVDTVLELLRGREVCTRRGGRPHDGSDEGETQRDAPAEAHGALST